MKTFIFAALFTFLLSINNSHAVNEIAHTLENGMKSQAIQMLSAKEEVDDIVKAYFATTASALVGAAATDGTAVTVGSKLSKLKFINGITMAQQLQNLFTNQIVTTGDYMASAVNLINGTEAASAALSQDVEVIGTRLVTLGNTMIQLKKSCTSILNGYNSSELSTALTNVAVTTIVFGGNVSKQKLTDGMNLCSQIQNFMQNAAVTQGDWLAKVTNWTQGS